MIKSLFYKLINALVIVTFLPISMLLCVVTLVMALFITIPYTIITNETYVWMLPVYWYYLWVYENYESQINKLQEDVKND